ncbi:hypothetical protein KM799_14895 [Clostridium tyrobutyricum]|uniref:hypothetical protein n=1 Tax=Clostridium tyrobutyricum TaxID=1519 RepID=UPI001C383445|nr:hypothetical protein [Clostridium tyrobutyricum]MBV4447882.1 hypothetical protein [Clostridium tyrobutyricum]
MKCKIICLIGFIMFIFGTYFSSVSNIMIVIGILGGGIFGCLASMIGYTSTKNKKLD